MDHKLSVLVQMDFENRSVRLVVTGCVTEVNQHALHPLVRRARTLTPPVTVSIDLSAAGHVEDIAVDLLRWAVDHDEPVPGVSPARILTPTRLPDHLSTPARTTGPRTSARSVPA